MAKNDGERNQTLEVFERLVSKLDGSVFAETHNSAVRRSLVDFARISDLLKRDIFYVELGGWDTHSDVLANTREDYKSIDAARGAFVAEM